MPHVLFIDDDYPSLILFEEVCRQHGLQYIGIQNPTDLAKSNLVGVDMVFVDLDMPLMNGYRVLELLQDSPSLQGVPKVACTVYTEQIDKARAAGFDSFIAKPLNLKNFPQQLLDLLNGQIIWETRT